MPALQVLTELDTAAQFGTEQVTEACRILRLNEKAVSSDAQCQKQIRRARDAPLFLGREQWVLKWLLKRLRAEGTSGAT